MLECVLKRLRLAELSCRPDYVFWINALQVGARRKVPSKGYIQGIRDSMYLILASGHTDGQPGCGMSSPPTTTTRDNPDS